MNRDLTENNACRLAKALIACYGITYEEAMHKLASFRLNLVCDQSTSNSVAMQAALITAVNAGHRAFHGGVYVAVPDGIPSLLPWPGRPSLAQICSSLGARLQPAPRGQMMQTIFLGYPCKPEADDLYLSATGWRGGVSPATSPATISSPIDFALGGVLAGALGIAKGFLRLAGIDVRRHAGVAGASLWDPASNWLNELSDGPDLQHLPQKLWILGLGHLGQAYLWVLGLLPFAEPQTAQFSLQDFDRAVFANLGSGSLCSAESVGKFKTRICADWLENRRFQTRIIERPFDVGTVPNDDEPFVALCGFDSAAARRLLQTPAFDLIIEAGIGSDLSSFDHVFLHTFPGAGKQPTEIWSAEPSGDIDPRLLNAFHPDERCGVVAQTLAGKAISTAFVGAIAATFVMGEVLRGLHGGKRSEFLRFQSRRDLRPTVVQPLENYQLRFARSGYVLAKQKGLAEFKRAPWSEAELARRRKGDPKEAENRLAFAQRNNDDPGMDSTTAANGNQDALGASWRA